MWAQGVPAFKGESCITNKNRINDTPLEKKDNFIAVLLIICPDMINLPKIKRYPYLAVMYCF